ncbi:hypothetical protein EV421DRAFT_1985867 [Armillaria borealis]|uniref:FAD-binding FR-type domain-containing protein n=1 Tax=Armillaria borealis TaxID=47425 RepID=A0AA39MJK0_9AGAR|nr:hypothetical protein EV421DRAFT_1985867 [Armillaria borealis]
MALYGWHPGEWAICQKVGIDKDPSLNWLYTSVKGDLPPDHGVFYMTRLPFLPITTLDSSGRPWGSILTGPDGEPGFISSPKYTTLSFNVKVWDGDPFVSNVTESGDDEMLMAGIGVEFSTRRRNKFAGKITKRKGHGDGYHFDVHVNEAIGNCPKYIPLRELVPYQGSPMTVFDKRHLSDGDELPDSVISFIQSCDTTFFGTTYAATEDDANRFPSHVSMNIRGGRPGFIRVRPSDKRTLILPDFSGNPTPLASLTLVSFTTGDVLYVTDAQKNMFLQDRLTTIHVTGYIFVRDALSSAPVLRFNDDSPATATLKSIVLHSSTITTFTWESLVELDIIPGQAIILDFSGFIGHPGYQHMAPRNPTSVNDDRIRTWTVSSSHLALTNAFLLTMHEKPGGAATGVLFSLARKIAEVRQALLEDISPLSLTIPIVGVMGDFTLLQASKRLALFAGEIGVVLAKMAETSSAREPDGLLPLIGEREGMAVRVFSDEAVPDSTNITVNQGHLTSVYLVDRWEDWVGRDVFVCGPESYHESVIDGLVEASVEKGTI